MPQGAHWLIRKQVRLADQARYHHALTASSLGSDCQACTAPLRYATCSVKGYPWQQELHTHTQTLTRTRIVIGEADSTDGDNDDVVRVVASGATCSMNFANLLAGALARVLLDHVSFTVRHWLQMWSW